MKVLNGEIFAASKPLETLSKERFPIKVSYKIAKLTKEFSTHLEIIEKIRVGLIQRYGEKDDKGNFTVNQNSVNFPKFFEEMNELFSQEVEINSEKIELPLEAEDKEINIEPNVLMLLDKFIEIK